jgi:hypothetical protein
MANTWRAHGFPIDLMTGVITPIPKAGRDSTLPTNTRPITVTSTWYRMYAGLIVNRLNAVNTELCDHA